MSIEPYGFSAPGVTANDDRTLVNIEGINYVIQPRPRPWRKRQHWMAPCWEQPGKQTWHLSCALRHPLRFLRSRGPKQWRPS